MFTTLKEVNCILSVTVNKIEKVKSSRGDSALGKRVWDCIAGVCAPPGRPVAPSLVRLTSPTSAKGR